jgi:hypothetical protein
MSDRIACEGLDRVLFATRSGFPFARHPAHDVQDSEQEHDTNNAQQN